MAYETSIKDSKVAIRNKLKKLIEDSSTLCEIKKVYKGTPNAIPNYPAVMLDWEVAINEQVNQGKTGIQRKCEMNIIVLEKYLKYGERQDKLLELTGKIEKLIVNNRYLDGLRASDDSWKVRDVQLAQTRYEALVKPNTFVLDSSEIKIIIITEGI